jgi:hypothetical protein
VCYSLEASFAVGAALAAVGFATTRKALRSNRSMLVFAFFPAMFSLHQIIKGIVWFSIEQPFHASVVFRYSYIFIAFLVWPVLAPLAAAVATTDHWWRRVWVLSALIITPAAPGVRRGKHQSSKPPVPAMA